MNVIAHNLTAMNAQRQFGITNKRQAKATEKLSSGYKINRSADDAAGLAMSEKMRRQVRGLNQAAENIQEGIGYVQVADGALNEVHDILHRINELAVKSANGTNQQEDREYIDQEVQQLKEELDRIFDTTAFNERLIWEPNGVKKQIGTELKQAVTSTTNYTSVSVTNENYDILAYGSYVVNADDQGISISWTGFNGKSYETDKIDWDTLKEEKYSFEMSDYFSDADLFDSNGNPLITKRISFNVVESATTDDIITCLNGRYMSGNENVSMSVRFEDSTGASKSNTGVSVHSANLNYGAAYASKANNTDGHDFDAADDIFLEPTGGSGKANLISYPSATTVADAQNSSEGWTFSFDMKGVGTVTAKSYNVSYGPTTGDYATDDETYWWNWDYYYSNGNKVYYKDPIERGISGGTLGNVMEALTGDKSSNTPGLLTAANGGAADAGGYIDISFNLTADQEFAYGTTTSKSVGSFDIRISVSSTDTEASVLKKINDALNSNTVVDFYTGSGGYDSASIGSLSPNSHQIDVPIWGGACNFYVQAGTEAEEKIHITYDSLGTIELKMEDTNVLTDADCARAINEVDFALQEISKQRAHFGAYQNRLEHAYNNNKNIEENTQAAESQIRDTDMAEMMVEYSNNSILMQAGQAMMAQANQSNQGVLSLLQ